jgi:hypothetical protein
VQLIALSPGETAASVDFSFVDYSSTCSKHVSTDSVYQGGKIVAANNDSRTAFLIPVRATAATRLFRKRIAYIAVIRRAGSVKVPRPALAVADKLQ